MAETVHAPVSYFLEMHAPVNKNYTDAPASLDEDVLLLLCPPWYAPDQGHRPKAISWALSGYRYSSL